MNREIKFRVWAGNEMEYKVMAGFLGAFYVQGIDETDAASMSNMNTKYPDAIVPMQYTGLKSSDGGCGLPIEDCYFGDIIRFYNTDGVELLAEVIWYDKELCIGFKRLSDGFVYTQRNFNDNGYFQPSKIQFEIIGNIYENPDLIILKK